MDSGISVGLFFLPRKDSVTLKIVVVESLGIILSSLLPGAGFLTILAIFHSTLFFAATIGLYLDFKPGVRVWLSDTMASTATPPLPRTLARAGLICAPQPCIEINWGDTQQLVASLPRSCM